MARHALLGSWSGLHSWDPLGSWDTDFDTHTTLGYSTSILSYSTGLLGVDTQALILSLHIGYFTAWLPLIQNSLSFFMGACFRFLALLSSSKQEIPSENTSYFKMSP